MSTFSLSKAAYPPLPPIDSSVRSFRMSLYHLFLSIVALRYLNHAREHAQSTASTGLAYN
eukprot:scaffold666111_cov57-Prasinocladus_malaysianus.AAC.1